MRHGKKFNHLGRKTAHRKALLKNLSNALLQHKRIKTTLAKAKALRTHIEPIINRSKVDSTHNRRIAFSYLQDKEMVTELFNVISGKIADRPGGYTRVIKLGFRKGDAAEMAMIELVDFNDVYVADNNPDKTKTRRSRSRTKKSDTTENVASATMVEEVIEDIQEAPIQEEVVETVEIIEEVKEEAPAEVVQEDIEIKADDLKRVEGVGPAIEKLLNEKNIYSFEQLSKTTSDSLREILDEAGSRFNIHDPETWPFQAQLLFENRIEEFEKLTDELKGGKKVD